MAAILTIRLTDRFPSVQWCMPDGEVGAGLLADLLARSGPRPQADVLVPAGAVLLAEVSLPGRHRSRLLQALPFALEEQLTEDVESYHFALGQRLGSGRYLVAVVAQDRMSQWYRALFDAGVDVRCMLPETLALPYLEGTATVALEDDRALVRVSSSGGYAASLNEVGTFLELEPDIKQLRVLDYTGRWRAPPGLQTESLPTGSTLLADLVAGLRQTPLLDLMQGAYQSPRQRGARALRIWRWAAIFLLAAALLEATATWVTYRQDVSRLAELEQRGVALLQRTFPDIERVVEARGQMEQRLAALRGDGATQGFLYLLRLAGPGVSGQSGVTVESLVYRSDGLIVDLHAPDLATLEAVRRRIGSVPGLRVELLSATTLESGADGRLRIGGVIG